MKKSPLGSFSALIISIDDHIKKIINKIIFAKFPYPFLYNKKVIQIAIANKKILNLKNEIKIFLISKFSIVSLCDLIDEIQNSLLAREAVTKSL
mgnify:CR=1 FL=1